MESSISDQAKSIPASDEDRFEDVFVHHIAEIEQVWQQLNVARATSAKLKPSKSNPSQLQLHYPIRLSAIQQVANHELQSMRDYDEGEDGQVAESIDKEAGVLLSFLAAMFIENLSIKTMYHLPQKRMFGMGSKPAARPESSSSSAPPSNPQSSDPFGPLSSIASADLVIAREDIRRALLRDEQFDFLVQSGLAQPDLPGSDASLDEPIKTNRTISDRLHLGYWRIVERTLSALEIASPSSSSHRPHTLSHHPAQLGSKVMMRLAPESDPSHARFTLFPDNEELESNSVEFSVLNTTSSASGTLATLTGRVKLGHIDIPALQGHDVQISPDPSSDPSQSLAGLIPPMNFAWDTQNVEDEDFPISGRPTSAKGHGSVQLFDAHTAYDTFGSLWLRDCSWGVLSLEMTFQLGDTGFNLHNHYLAIPIFVQPPSES
jgi:hypothetical protein